MIEESTLCDALAVTSRQTLDAIKAFCVLDPEELSSAMVMAMLVSASGNEISNDDLSIAMKWASGIQTSVVALQFALAGVTKVSVANGQVVFSLSQPEDAMAALVRDGIATPV